MATAWVSATAAAAARTTTTAAAAAEQYSGGGGNPSAFEFSWKNAAVAGRSLPAVSAADHTACWPSQYPNQEEKTNTDIQLKCFIRQNGTF